MMKPAAHCLDGFRARLLRHRNDEGSCWMLSLTDLSIMLRRWGQFLVVRVDNNLRSRGYSHCMPSFEDQSDVAEVQPLPKKFGTASAEFDWAQTSNAVQFVGPRVGVSKSQSGDVKRRRSGFSPSARADQELVCGSRFSTHRQSIAACPHGHRHRNPAQSHRGYGRQ